jgi:hypothetical protein
MAAELLTTCILFVILLPMMLIVIAILRSDLREASATVTSAAHTTTVTQSAANARRGGFSISWEGWLAIAGGVWLIIAPFILGYGSNTTAMLNDIIMGVLTLLFTAYVLVKASSDPKGAELSSFLYGPYILIGFWLLAASHLLGYSDLNSAFWNDVISGVLYFISTIYVLLFAYNKISEGH